MGKRYNLGEMTRGQVERYGSEAIAVLPLGSIEQHGEHLPLFTDSAIVERLVERAVKLTAGVSPLVVAPTLHIGDSQHHLAFCALSFRSETYTMVLRDICHSLYASGFRRLFFVNGHGGNDLAMKLVARDIIGELDVTTAACSYWSLSSANLPGDPPPMRGSHAGVGETSIMMHLTPELIRDPDPDIGDERAFFTMHVSDGLQLQRSGEYARIGGVTERTDGSTAGLGEQMLNERARALAAAIDGFDEISRGNS